MDESISSTESMNVGGRETRPETRIGSYRVVQPLGIGGMSSVFRAVHAETNQEVALKVLTRSLAKNATLLQRFLREARSAETLDHPNIVAIYDRGIDSGRHYLVLEYVGGGDFHDYIQRQGPLSLVEALEVVRSVAAGLKYAANQGLIHRDIKPSNILRTPQGQIKIIDLGLALQHEFEDERVTREGTTVGTVDYMAPEQARDSRATSIQSDMYSLGCTLYYLLTGVPPYPGGDITDKLTRHAKNPPPDVRDLRPDLPDELSTILLRLMAKRPEDRFASYDQFTSAIDAVPLRGGSEAPGITLAPISGSSGAASAGYGFDISQAYRSASRSANGSAEATIPLGSLGELVGEDPPNAIGESQATRPFSEERRVLRRDVSQSMAVSAAAARDHAGELENAAPVRSSIPVSAWILPGVFLCAAMVILGIGVVQFMGASDIASSKGAVGDARGDGAPPDRTLASSPRASAVSAMAEKPLANDATRKLPANSSGPATRQPPEPWHEPQDFDDEGTGKGTPELTAAAAKYLPDWARSPIPEKIDGPFVVVRRVADPGDQTTVSSLSRALDGHIGGTVELADEGPLWVEDFRITGETRLIRARRGFRPIVRIDRTSQTAVRNQAAVVVLSGKNLTLDGIDLIVDVRDLSRTQTAFFLCAGSNLTLRNCSITILNQTASRPFSLVRTEAAGARPTYVRFERCLIRGSLAEGFRLNGGPCEVVLRDSVILAGDGPTVRLVGPDAAPHCRVVFVQSLVAGPGPIIDWTKKAVGGHTKALEIRAFGSVFGRLHGSSIASVMCSNDSTQEASKQIDWSGDANLFAGWKGFFACGADQTVTVTDLAAARSTWNGIDSSSREILAPWAHPGDLAAATPADFSSFVPNHSAILERAARPRAGLYEKAVGAYSDPAVPDPVGWAFEGTTQGPVLRSIDKPGLLPPEMTNMRATGYNPTRAPAGPLELVFETNVGPWGGDLGAFLRDRITNTMTVARVRVHGSGRHRFTPVKLPPGLRLEVRVEPSAQAEPPSWSPAEGATGTALIELQGGTLVLTNLVVRHEATARLEHLIHVEDGHLVLARCQLLGGVSPDSGGDLIAFRSASTQPRPVNGDGPLFSFSIDRPVCRLVDCVLITGGRALYAELGRGLVALSQCAVAASGTAIELTPAKVARARFVADLELDRCTLTSERAIVKVGSWPGLAPGPDRPWLITSRGCAFLAMTGRAARESVLLRSDADALAKGAVFWQAKDDAAEVDWFLSTGDAPPPSNRLRDVQQQWVHFWGRSHMGRVTGPRGAGSQPSVRFRERLRSGQAIEPANLILDASYHPYRQELTVGADLSHLGLVRVPATNPRGGPPL
jgi:serine/threonine-protein kinase